MSKDKQTTLKRITLTGSNATDSGEFRDSGTDLVVDVDISAERAAELIGAGRAIDADAVVEPPKDL